MSSARSLLTRVRKLEHGRMPVLSPFERDYGSVEMWQAVAQAGLDEGLLDRRDMPLIMSAVARWHRDGVWAL